MFCNKCGNSVNEGDVFCSKCGNSLKDINNQEVSINEEDFKVYDVYTYNDTTPKEKIITGESFYSQQDNDNQYYNYQDNNNNYNYQDNNVNSQKETVGFAITSMVLGILSILLSCSYIYVSIILSVLALIFGIIHLKNKKSGQGMAIAGICTGAISILIKIILFILVFFGVIALGNKNLDLSDYSHIFDEFEDYDYNYDDEYDYDENYADGWRKATDDYENNGVADDIWDYLRTRGGQIRDSFENIRSPFY